jgi:hypothetical protein
MLNSATKAKLQEKEEMRKIKINQNRQKLCVNIHITAAQNATHSSLEIYNYMLRRVLTHTQSYISAVLWPKILPS